MTVFVALVTSFLGVAVGVAVCFGRAVAVDVATAAGRHCWAGEGTGSEPPPAACVGCAVVAAGAGGCGVLVGTWGVQVGTTDRVCVAVAVAATVGGSVAVWIGAGVSVAVGMGVLVAAGVGVAGGDPVPLDPAATTNATIIAFRSASVVNNDMTYTATEVVGDGDLLLEPGELFTIEITETDNTNTIGDLIANDRYTLEIQTPVGAVLDLTRSLPAQLDAVMQLH